MENIDENTLHVQINFKGPAKSQAEMLEAPDEPLEILRVRFYLRVLPDGRHVLVFRRAYAGCHELYESTTSVKPGEVLGDKLEAKEMWPADFGLTDLPRLTLHPLGHLDQNRT